MSFGTGTGSARLSALRIQRFVCPMITINSMVPNALTWRFEDGSFRVSGNWMATYKLIFIPVSYIHVIFYKGPNLKTLNLEGRAKLPWQQVFFGVTSLLCGLFSLSVSVHSAADGPISVQSSSSCHFHPSASQKKEKSTIPFYALLFIAQLEDCAKL